MFIKHIIVNVTAVIIYNRLTSSKQVQLTGSQAILLFKMTWLTDSRKGGGLISKKGGNLIG